MINGILKVDDERSLRETKEWIQDVNLYQSTIVSVLSLKNTSKSNSDNITDTDNLTSTDNHTGTENVTDTDNLSDTNSLVDTDETMYVNNVALRIPLTFYFLYHEVHVDSICYCNT